MINKYLLSLFLLLSFNFFIGQTNINSYIFGHSLVNHSTNASIQNRSNIPDWLDLIAEQDGNSYSVDGQFGFLPYQTLPPIFQWGFINATNTRTDNTNSNFAFWNYDNVVVTLANFIQYTQPSDNAFCDQAYINDCNQDPNALSSVEAVLRILDFARIEEPSVNFYIYENWPEFTGTFPPTNATQEASEFAAYYNYAQGNWHNWWIDLQDLVLLERPNSNVKLIPVGPILAKLFSNNGILSSIPATTLYEDEAPHGYPVTYFITALIHYSVMYGKKPPVTFQFPDNALSYPIRIPDIVRNNYNAIVDFIWLELQNYTFGNGQSRVFLPNQVLSNQGNNTFNDAVKIFPNPSTNKISISVSNDNFVFSGNEIKVKIYNIIGQEVFANEIMIENNSFDLSIENFNNGSYFIKIYNNEYSFKSSFIKN